MYCNVENDWNSALRIRRCGNEDNNINIVTSDIELLKLHFLWIWVFHLPAFPLGFHLLALLPIPSCSLQMMPPFSLSCCLHEMLDAVQNPTCTYWLWPNQQKWCCRASCCSLPAAEALLLISYLSPAANISRSYRNLIIFSASISIELDWSEPMDLQMVKEGKGWQRIPTCEHHFFSTLVQRIELSKVWYFKKCKTVWTVIMFVQLWGK